MVANGFVAYGVGLDASGNVVVGAGVTGIKGIMIGHGKHAAGDIVDVMTGGEIVATVGDTWTAGTNYTANTTTGLITNAAASGTQIAVGYTVEATRMVVGKHV